MGYSMASHEEKHQVEDTSEVDPDGLPPVEGDMEGLLASIEQELNSLVSRCEQTTAQHARELDQKQAEIDRTLQIALKRQSEIDRHSAELRSLATQVANAESELSRKRRSLAQSLRRRRAQLAQRMTAAVDRHARRAADELEARAKELAHREAELAGLLDVRQLIDDQAALTAEQARTMDALLRQREQASMELLERLSDACGLADRVRELSDSLRESRLEVREYQERAETAERERQGSRSALEAARARIAQLEARIDALHRDNLLLEQRLVRERDDLQARESRLAQREQHLRAETLRLAEDQAACDQKLRELGHRLAQNDRLERARRLDPRTPLPVCSWPLPVCARRRPELRLVN